MPDDERTRRRLGDDTLAKIADLADGWTTPKAPPPAPEEPAAPPRARPKTLPPPPPGSAARKALESQILDAAPAPRPARTTTMPPPLPAPTPPASLPPPVPPPLPPGASPVASPPARTRPTAPPPPPRASPTRPPIDPDLLDPIIPLDQPKPRPKALTSPSPAVAVNAARPASTTSPPRPAPSRTTPPAVMPAIPAPPAAPPTVVEIAPAGLQRGDDTGLPTIPQAALAALDVPDPVIVPPEAVLAPAALAAQGAAALLPTSAVTASGRVPIVPLGEFDDGPGTVDDAKLRQRQAQATMKRDAAEALLRMPPPAPPPRPPKPPSPPPPPPSDDDDHVIASAASLRGDPTSVDPTASDVRYERGDPTALSSGTAATAAAARGPAATLRAGAALRRKRGLLGDVRYVFTALFGVRRTRGELADLQVRQETKQASRRRHLVTLGRTAMLSEFQHAAMDAARSVFEQVEDERSGHAGQVAAADAEVDRVRRDRDALAKQHAAETAALDAELAALAKKLEPLDKEAAAVQRRADALREALAKLDAQITATQNSLISLKGQRLDKAAVQAEVATLRADRQAVQRDEPIIAAELDTLQPRIAALRAQRATAQQRRADIAAAEAADRRRTEELLAAIGAKRKVVDRAAGEAETARDQVLFELGDKLYVDRPSKLAAQLAPIDAIDLELGEGDRRAMELREILSNVDKAKLARGLFVITLLVAGAAAVAVWLARMALAS